LEVAETLDPDGTNGSSFPYQIMYYSHPFFILTQLTISRTGS
jgi:hypothetical protein